MDWNHAGFFGFFDSPSDSSRDTDILEGGSRSHGLSFLSPPVGYRCREICQRRLAERCGLAAGTPIAVGAGDRVQGRSGAGIVRSGLVSISMGTAGAVNAYSPTVPRPHLRPMMAAHHSLHGRWLLEGYQAAAAGVYRWFQGASWARWEQGRGREKGTDLRLINEEAAAVPCRTLGLVFLPTSPAAATPRYNSDARGTSWPACTADRLRLALRAIHGGHHAGHEGHDPRASGMPGVEAKTRCGSSAALPAPSCGTRSRPTSMERLPDAEGPGRDGARAAILGGVGAGVFTSVEAGADAMVQLGERFEPVPENMDMYARLYDTYCRAYEGLDKSGVFATLGRNAEFDAAPSSC